MMSCTRGVPGRRPSGLVVPAVLTAALVNLPLIYILMRVVEGGLDNYLEHVLTLSTALLIARTLLLVLGVLALALLLAVPIAWLVVRSDLPGRRAWAVTAALPLVFPSYVSAFSLVAVLGPRGTLQGWLEPLGVTQLPGFIYGYPGAVLALALFTYPYVYLLVVAALRRLDPALEESSRSLGVGRWHTFLRGTVPALWPAITGGTVLVALYTLSDFGAVSITRYDTFTVSIYNAYRALFDRRVAAALATVLVGLTVAIIALQARVTRRSRPHVQRPSRRTPPVSLGRWRLPCLLGLVGVKLFTLGIPVGVLVTWGIQGLWHGNPLSAAWQPAANSLVVSALAALAAVVAALPITIWTVRYGGTWARVIERLSFTGYALPGIVIALALVFFAVRAVPYLYQSPTLLVAAYLVRFLPQAITASRSALAAVGIRFEEVARSLGRSPLQIFRTLTLPLIRPGLLAGAALVFLTAMKELPATLILRPIGFETLSTRVWSAAAEGLYAEASVPGLMLVLVSSVPVYALIIRPALAERG